MTGRLFNILENYPAGVELPFLSARPELVSDPVDRLVSEGLREGVLEHWPFWPGRIRATGKDATPYLCDLARLRKLAWPVLERISAASGWPATLHVLVPGAHNVVERFPWTGDAEEIAREQSRYATPRSLREGGTAMAIVANISEPDRMRVAARLGIADRRSLFDEILAQGYCLRGGADVRGGWILSAALMSAQGVPFGALCTYGFAPALPDNFAADVGGLICESATRLSRQSGEGPVARRARAIVDALAQER